MDKTEYQSKLDEINKLVSARDFAGALEIVQGIDWRRVKNVRTLSMVADIYEAGGMYQDSKRILTLALSRASIGKTILYRLVEVSIKTGELADAEKYYQAYIKAAAHDNSKYVLQYKIYRAKKMPIEDQILVLEEYKSREYTERWAYELAKLYGKAQMKERCIEECDDLILWFSEGKYVLRAMELKMKFTPLSPSQAQSYQRQRAELERTQRQSAVSEEAAVQHAQAEAAVTLEKEPTEEVQPKSEDLEALQQEKKAKFETDLMNNSLQPGQQQVNPALLGNTVNIQQEFVKNIRDMFANMKEPVISEAVVEQMQAVEQEEESALAQENEALEVKELEPEQIDSSSASIPSGKPKTYIPQPAAEAKEEQLSELESVFEPGASVIDLSGFEDMTQEAPTEQEEREEKSHENTEAKTTELPEIPEITTEVVPEKQEEEVPEEPTVVKELESESELRDKTGIPVGLVRDEKKSQTKPLFHEKPERMSIEEVLREETPEERRNRILNDTRPEKLTEEQRKQFGYFAKVPGMDQQILDAMNGVYHHAGEKTSKRGNIAVMGGQGTGKSKLSDNLVRAICKDLGIQATKMARLDAAAMNRKNPALIVGKLAGGFLLIERAGLLDQHTIDTLSQALEFRTDSLTLIIEDEKTSMRRLLNNYPEFAKKFETVISIPVFTNDELVTFARTYAKEMGYKMDEMGVLALYTLIGDNQTDSEPITITKVKEMVDEAVKRSQKFGRRFGKKRFDEDDNIILYEKDFDF